ncbi:MAG: MotA/TolQ/ExbB proton channel family protein [Chlamydiae bacterium]|nr:MotA/TolQ/ExbB proton channel family protein [Chlamydiota bacterium]
MKRIALSLGSLSLVLMQAGQCAPANSADYPLNASSISLSSEEIDPLALLESDLQELDAELSSLEQELEDEQMQEALSGNSAALEEMADSASPLPLKDAEESDSVISDLSIEESHAPLDEEEEIAMEDLSPEENESLSINSEEDDRELESAIPSTRKRAKKKTNSEIALNETEENTLLESLQSPIIEEVSLTDPIAPVQETAPAVENKVSELAPTEKLSPKETVAVAPIPAAAEAARSPAKALEISLPQVFAGSPTIYLTLLLLSLISVALWLFNSMSLKKYASTRGEFIRNLHNKLVSNHYDEVLVLCKQDNGFFAKMIASGVRARRYGLQFMLESMKSEGKRASVSYWQRLNILQDIAIIAPMIGLLGTVLGMFYAFYDLNRSFESISSLFDGLGISVGTTVAGIFVAILAMVLHSTSKYRLVKSLTFVENEAVTLAHLMDNKHSH